MKRIILFQDSFLVSGIMCFQGCGNTIQNSLHSCIGDCIDEKLLPRDAQLIIYSEPTDSGIHRLFLYIETETEDFVPDEDLHATLLAKLQDNTLFDIVPDQDEERVKKSNKINWINIFINLLAMAAIISLALIFPPSILLTVGLTVISFLATAFTAREYLINFFRNLRNRNLANMTTTISLGWFLSLGHTLFHAITMPLASSFSMIFMNFIMPVMLVTCINGMDEVKRLIIDKAKKLRLEGMKALFPQMAEKYRCYQLSQLQMNMLTQKMTAFLQNINEDPSVLPDSSDCENEESPHFIEKLLATTATEEEEKNILREGMLIEVNQGECFPVDCILVHGHTIIDASLLTGESQQSRQRWQDIPAGAVNLGQTVTVYATKNTYNSTVNSLLFRSNRARNMLAPEAVPKFAYFYTALVILGLIAAIVAPVAFGVITIPLVMQNVFGFLFSLCPCTIAIAHELPNLTSLHHLNSKGIHLRDESLSGRTDEIHTIVFDKTGTLTTGNSVVESSSIPAYSPLWQRIHLLEEAHGGGHPLAKAILNYNKRRESTNVDLNDVKNYAIDPDHRGLSAIVQERAIHIGNEAYIRSIDENMPLINQEQIELGYSPVYIAEDGVYQGVIYIKHEPRKGIIEALARLKREGKRIIMLTGDNELSAKGFNKQIGGIFDDAAIHAGQTPQNKETFLQELMGSSGADPKGVWFVGDGLNDAPCCRIVSEIGGVSCAMENSDKSAFFTDICLNGSLDYLFHHNKLNRFLHHSIIQNQWVLTYGTIVLLAFIVSFSVVGIAVSPLIPMAIMLSTTLFVLFNSYRSQLAIDNALDKESSWTKKILASNVSIGLLVGASALLICSVLVATIATGGLALPVIAFTAGALTAFCSVCSLTAIGLASAFALLLATHLVTERFTSPQATEVSEEVPLPQPNIVPVDPIIEDEARHDFDFFTNLLSRNRVQQVSPSENSENPVISF